MRRWVLDRLDDQTERGIVNTVAESDDHVFSMTGRELREVMELLTARITGAVVKQIEGQADQGHSES